MFRRKSSKKAAVVVAAPLAKAPPPSGPAPTPSHPPTQPRKPKAEVLPITLSQSVSTDALHDERTLRRSTSSVRASKARVTVPTTGPSSFHKPSGFRALSPPPPSVPRSRSNPEGFARTSTSTDNSPYGYTHQSPGGRHSSTFSIASLYPSPTTLPPPPDLPPLGVPKSASLPNVRRAHKSPPTFNLIVVGAKKTGKTALVKTLLANVAVQGSEDELARVRKFGLVSARQEPKVARTQKAQAVTVDVFGRGDKFQMTVIDTVGLDIPMGEGRVGDELDVERQLGGILRTIEARFDETLKAENQVFRHSHRAHDAHLHLALYLIHPESIAPRPPSRKTKTSLGTLNLRKSQSTPSLALPSGPDTPPVSPTWSDDGEPSMSEIDLRCIKKLSRRVNVLPIIARADELSATKLVELKAVVKRDLSRSGLDFGTFSSGLSPALAEEDEDAPRRRGRTDSGNSGSAKDSTDDEPVRVIRVRSKGRHTKIRGAWAEDEREREDVGHLLPFALVAPESFATGGDGLVRFQREFRYGTLDVLNPEHSDFLALRDALLGSQMRLLKEATRLEKYEPFRTQRLLAKRGTRILSDEAKNSIIKDLDIL